MSVSFINPFLAAPPPPPPPPGDTLGGGINANYYLFDSDGIGGKAYAGFVNSFDGNLYRTYWDQPQTLLDAWLATGDAAAFEVRATLTQGALQAGSAQTGVWLACDAQAYQWWIELEFGVRECRFLVEWRDVATQTIQESTNVWLNVEIT